MKRQLAIFLSLCCSYAFAHTPPPFERDFQDYSPLEDSPCEEEKPIIMTPLQPDQGINLNIFNPDFILETKRIKIPHYPLAFNPSIIRWQGKLLMSFRFFESKTHSANPFALVWLSEDFEPISTPQTFQLPFYNPILPSKQQDPRLVAVGERLFVVYNNILEHITNREMRRMFVAELHYDGATFTASEPECLLYFERENDMRYEKNWVPFAYDDQLHLAYSIEPHLIFRPLLGISECETVAKTKSQFTWPWGQPRGGTQAILDGDHYIAFFHSWIDMPSQQSGGKKISHYFMAAYTFESKPPFSLIAVSPQPIVAKDFYTPPYYKTWKPLRCIFPMGLIVNEDHLWISYGRQDHEMWVVKIDKKALLDSLVPVTHDHTD